MDKKCYLNKLKKEKGKKKPKRKDDFFFFLIHCMLKSGLVFKLLDQLLLHLLGELTLAIESKSRIAEPGWAFTLALDTACSALL